MPFKSKAQQKFMFAAEERGDLPKGTAKRWADETPSIKKLPKKVKKKSSKNTKKAHFLERQEIADLVKSAALKTLDQSDELKSLAKRQLKLLEQINVRLSQFPKRKAPPGEQDVVSGASSSIGKPIPLLPRVSDEAVGRSTDYRRNVELQFMGRPLTSADKARILGNYKDRRDFGAVSSPFVGIPNQGIWHKIKTLLGMGSQISVAPELRG